MSIQTSMVHPSTRRRVASDMTPAPLTLHSIFYPMVPSCSENIKDESFPPKPKELFMTFLVEQSLFVSVNGVISSFREMLTPILLGLTPLAIDRRHITASIEPEALVVCPVNGLVEEKSGNSAPHIRSIAASSQISLLGVPVP